MARFNEILVGRYNRYLQKLLSMKGQASLVTLSDEMFVALPLFTGVENRYLEGWERFAVFNRVAAVAAQIQGVRLRNPSGSNVVACIESIKITNDTAAADSPVVERGPTTADLATVTALSTNRLDPRGRPQPTLIRSTGDVTASRLTGVWQASFPANSHTDFIQDEAQEIPLLPGDAIQGLTNVTNQVVIVSFVWRERFLEDSERA
jgi:hypothetical protein